MLPNLVTLFANLNGRFHSWKKWTNGFPEFVEGLATLKSHYCCRVRLQASLYHDKFVFPT